MFPGQNICSICQGGWMDADQGLIMCASCRQVVHGACDQQHITQLQQTQGPSALYTCPRCRELAMQQSKIVLANYEVQLQAGRPQSKARSGFGIYREDFIRIFSKDEQLASSGLIGSELQAAIQQAWDTLQPSEREVYDDKGRSEQVLFQAQLAQYTAFYSDYARICASVGVQPKFELAPATIMAAALGQSLPTAAVGGSMGAAAVQLAGSKRSVPEAGSARAAAGGRGPAAFQQGRVDGPSSDPESDEDAGAYVDESDEEWGAARAKKNKKAVGKGGKSDGGGKRPRASASLNSLSRGFGPGGTAGASSSTAGAVERGGGGSRAPRTQPNITMLPGVAPGTEVQAELGVRAPAIARAVAAAPSGFMPALSIDDLPPEMVVSCSGVQGVFLMETFSVLCGCRACVGQPAARRTFHPTHWEAHTGAGSAKKWKASIKIEPGGGAPEVPPSAPPMPIGRYFDLRGVEFKPARTLGGPPMLEFTGSSMIRERAIAERLPRAPAAPSLPPVAKRVSRPPPDWVSAQGSEVEAVAHASLAPLSARMLAGDGGDAQPLVPFTPWEDATSGNFLPIKVRWAGDRCCVCDLDIDYDYDQLVTCEECGLSMHQSCYGIPDVPGPDEVWLCRVCETRDERGKGAPEPQCCLCPVSGGALKRTTLPGQWCHAACMQWVPEVTCGDPLCMEPIDRIEHIQRERWELLCCCCHQKMGAKIQCNSCYQAFHPLCGRMAGLQMEIVDQPAGKGLKIVAYCPRHCFARPELSGMQVVRDSEVLGGLGDGDNADGLWNCQPFIPPPAVDMPRTKEGCARAQPLDAAGWSRMTHGTGAGCTTTAAFWMPPEPDLDTAAAAWYDGLGALFGSGRGGRGGRGGGRGTGRVGRPPLGGGRGGPPIPVGPPPKVDLLPLPPGCDETVAVVCNHRQAVLTVRTQRVLYDGTDMAASRFEQVCGRGDAKKWKSSLWVVGVHGRPDTMVADYFARFSLDRAALAALANNAAAHETYNLWRASLTTKTEAGAGAAGTSTGPAAAGGAEGVGTDAGGATAETRDAGTPGPTAREASPGFAARPEEASTATPGPAATVSSVPLEQPTPATEPTTATSVGGSTAAGITVVPAPATEPAAPPPPPPPVMKLVRPMGLGLDSLVGPADVAPPATEVLPAGIASEAPDRCVGSCVRVYWPDDYAWYEADVVEWKVEDKKHRLWYHIDENTEWLDLGEEERAGRIQWLPNVDRSHWPPPPPAPKRTSPAPEEEARTPASPHDQQPTDTVDRAGASAEAGAEPMDAEGGGAVVAGAEAAGGAGTAAKQPGTGSLAGQDAAAGSTDAVGQPAGAAGTGAGAGAMEMDDMLESDAALLLSAASEAAHAQAAAVMTEPPSELAQPTGPSTVDVVCNGLRGTFLTERLEVQLADGRTVSGTEFERMAGRGAAKKWKVSIRVAKPDGTPGSTIQDFLVSSGFEVPRAARGLGNKMDTKAGAKALSDKMSADGGLDAVRRRATTSVYRRSESGTDAGAKDGGAGGKGGPRVHRAACMCIICKQARGMAARGTEDGAAPASTTPATTATATTTAGPAPAKYRHRGPVVRYGKRAYVRAVPHVVGGMRFHKPWRVPSGSSWSPAEWVATRLPAVVATELQAAAELMGDEEEQALIVVKVIKEEPDAAGPATGAEALGEQGAQAPAGMDAGVGASTGVVVKAEPGVEAAAQGVDSAAGTGAGAGGPSREVTPVVGGDAAPSAATPSMTQGEAAAPTASAPAPSASAGVPATSTGAPGASTGAGAAVGVAPRPARVRAPVPWRDRLRKAREQEPRRLTFGKSGIHGWGLFALKDFPQDSLVIEYRGDAIRSSLSDLREAGYRATGRDCYLFRASDAVVVDSTMVGSWSRFTNHCCAPSLYTKVVTDSSGAPHIAFFAKTDIKPGQELTYDYRFKEEEESKVRCQCGAPNCKGFLN